MPGLSSGCSPTRGLLVCGVGGCWEPERANTRFAPELSVAPAGQAINQMTGGRCEQERGDGSHRETTPVPLACYLSVTFPRSGTVIVISSMWRTQLGQVWPAPKLMLFNFCGSMVLP